jgi:hypothetical protein
MPDSFQLLRLAELFRKRFALGNVFDGAFVVKNCATFIVDSTHVLHRPYLAPVFAIDLTLIAHHDAVFSEHLLQLCAGVCINVMLCPDVGTMGHQVLSRLITQNANHRRVHGNESAVGSGLKDSFDGILKNAPVLRFSLFDRTFGALALCDVLDDTCYLLSDSALV